MKKELTTRQNEIVDAALRLIAEKGMRNLTPPRQITLDVNDERVKEVGIIDMTFLTAKPTGFVTFVHGYTIERGVRTQCIVSTVSKAEAVADNKVLGCFVVASHCSIPSIRKMVAPYMNYIRFVLIYTVDDGLLTAIPIVNQDLCSDTAYYGEKNLEELKIWTRRKR